MDTLPNIETRNDKRILLKELFSLSDQDEVLLTEGVRHNKGAIQMWVHSHYQENGPEGLYRDLPEEVAKREKYKQKRQIAMKATARSDMPIISLVGGDVDEYSGYYNEAMVGYDRSIYYVRTPPNDPTPLLNSDQDRQDWDVFCERLKKLGISKVILRGRDLYFWRGASIEGLPERTDAYTKYSALHPELIRENREGEKVIDFPEGCVGRTWLELETRGLKVLQSVVTYPETVRS